MNGYGAPEHSDDLSLALTLADLADAITVGRFGASDLAVETKPDLTPVSESDKAAELAIREHLREVAPEDAVVGEEFGAEEATNRRRWIVDPIDGTKSYVRGVPTWSTLIALQVDGHSTVAVVSMPAVGRRWWATRGGGAYAAVTAAPVAGAQPAVSPRVTRVGVSAVADLADAQMGWSGIEDWDAVGRGDAALALARSCWRTRGIGDVWQYMLVAEGAFEIATDPEATLWDLAAPALIVEEAGGRFTSLAGEPGPGAGSGLATNGILHERVRALLGG
ncbi:inositol monophosphatase family protein [Conexibacter sp. DBS9H8]|uniref:inositol monophosphatase family protein n=1 Tax=Conexibacter sp. DBS9H8 TaxID=2937801 RepID=UPI00200E7B9B|nr:inositol monophosphatase family protein [Conexibacter sp. DBS9H8]